MPTPAPAPVEPAQAPVAPVDAPAHVAAEPSPPEPARTALGGPPTTVDNWPAQVAAVPKERIYRGFSLRLSAEHGLARTDREIEGAVARCPGCPVENETKISGFNAGVALDVGAAAIDNLIVYGRVGAFAFNHGNRSDSPDVGTAYYGLLGAGARYHFMPFDWYGSGTLSLALMAVTSDRGKVENADPGVGLQLETGKNWSSGADDPTSVGLGLRFTYVSCGSVGDPSNQAWNTKALSVVFSLAYN